MKTSVISIILILALQLNLKAQGTQGFAFVLYPQSVSGFGAGEMGVASLTNDDALVYNPAKLSLTKNARFSFYRNPLNLVWPMPLTSYTLYHNVLGVGSFAVNYENQNFGEVVRTSSELDPNGQIIELGRFNSFNTALTFGYAKSFSENFSAGIGFRYSWWNFSEVAAYGFFLSLGGLYTPDFCERKFTFGFSLMNLGPAVKFESGALEGSAYYDPPPTMLNLGLNFTAAENEYFSLPLSLAISKPFDKRDEDGQGESSFKTLFTDWKDFPNDAALHTGLSFIWKPLYFSDNFAFFQEFYAGNFSDGIKTHLQNFYTHGMNFGLEFYDYKFSAGYAGVSHNVHYPNFFQWVFPYETFQFTFGVNSNLFNEDFHERNHPALDHIILSLGFGEILRLGKARTYPIQALDGFKYEAENNLSYAFESAFYFDENQALVTSVNYNSIPFSFSVGSFKLLESKIETFSFFSSYRYHFLEDFEILFVQGGLGIIRMNPIVKTQPRYDYHTALQASAGLTLELPASIIIMPAVEYNFILNYLAFPPVSDAPRILGYNQVNFALKIGYKIL